MTEINLQPDVFERINEYKRVFAELISEDAGEINTDYMANAVLSVGLDLMMVDFFRNVDDKTLEKSIALFHQAYPNTKPVQPVEYCNNQLVNTLAALSRHYPKQFFTFMLETLKATGWAAARERFRRLFPEE